MFNALMMLLLLLSLLLFEKQIKSKQTAYFTPQVTVKPSITFNV